MAGGDGKGIDWMLNLDARTQGAMDVIAALEKSRAAAIAAGEAIDKAMQRTEERAKERKRIAAEEVEWNAAISKAKERINFEERAGKEIYRQHLSAQNAEWESAANKAKARIEAEERTGKFVKNRAAFVALEAHEIEKANRARKEGIEREFAEKSLLGDSVAPMWHEFAKGAFVVEGIKMAADLAIETVKKLGETIVEAVQMAGKGERRGRVFENLLGKEGAEETLDYLEKFAKMSEFTGDELQDLSAPLIDIGIKGANFRNALAMSADIAARSLGDKTAAFAEAINSFVQIERRGKVDARILGGLKLNPHEVEEQLAKDLGRTKETIAKQLTEGTLKGSEAMDSIMTVFERKTGKKLGSLTDGMTDTFEKRMADLKDIPEELFKSMKDTAGFKAISDTIGEIAEAFGPESAAGKALREGLGHLIDVVGEKLKSINWTHVADSVTKIVDKISDWVDPVIKIAEYMAKIVEYAIKGIGVISDITTAITNPGKFLADKIFGSASDAVSEQGRARKLEADNLAGWAEVAKESGAAVGEAGIEGYKEATETHSPSRVWMELGRNSVEGLVQGFEYEAPGAAAVASAVASPPDMGDGQSIGGGFNAGGIQVTVQVNVGGASGSPQEIGREASEQTVAALIPALEQFAIQAGLA